MPSKVFKAPSKDALIYLRNVLLYSSAATVAGGAVVHVYNDFRQIQELHHRIERSHQINSLLRHYSAAANDVYIPKDKFIIEWEAQHGPIGPRKKRRRKEKARKHASEASATTFPGEKKEKHGSYVTQEKRARTLLAKWFGLYAPSRFVPSSKLPFRATPCRFSSTLATQALASTRLESGTGLVEGDIPTPIDDFEAAFADVASIDPSVRSQPPSRVDSWTSFCAPEENLRGASDNITTALGSIGEALKSPRPWKAVGAVINDLHPGLGSKSIFLQPKLWAYLARHQPEGGGDKPELTLSSLFGQVESPVELARNFTTLFVQEDSHVVLPRSFVRALLRELAGPLDKSARLVAWSNLTPILSWLRRRGLLGTDLSNEFFRRWTGKNDVSITVAQERYELYIEWASGADLAYNPESYVRDVLDAIIPTTPLEDAFSWAEETLGPSQVVQPWMTAILSRTDKLLGEGKVAEALHMFAAGTQQLPHAVLSALPATKHDGGWTDLLSRLLGSAITKAAKSMDRRCVELSLAITSMTCRTGSTEPDWAQLDSLLRHPDARDALQTYLQYLPDMIEPSPQMRAFARSVDNTALRLPTGPVSDQRLFSYLRSFCTSPSPVEAILDSMLTLRSMFSSPSAWAIAWHKALLYSPATSAIYALFDQLIRIPVPLTESELEQCQKLQASFLQLLWETKGDVESVCDTFEQMTKYSNRTVYPALTDKFVWVIGCAQSCGKLAHYLQLPNVRSYRSTRPQQILALAKQGDWQGVSRLIKVLQAGPLNRLTASRLQRDLTRQLCKQADVEMAFSLWKDLIEGANLQPSSAALANLMGQALAEGKPALLRDMVDLFKQHRKKADYVTGINIIPSFVRWTSDCRPGAPLIQEFIAILHDIYPASITENLLRIARGAMRKEADRASRLIGMIQSTSHSSSLLVHLEYMAQETVETVPQSMLKLGRMMVSAPKIRDLRRHGNGSDRNSTMLNRLGMEDSLNDALHNGKPGDAARLFQRSMDGGVFVSRIALRTALADLNRMGIKGESKANRLLDEVAALGLDVTENRLKLRIYSDYANIDETANLVLGYVEASWKARGSYSTGPVARGAANFIRNSMFKEAIALLDAVLQRYPLQRPQLGLMTVYAIAYCRIHDMNGLGRIIDTVLDHKVAIDHEFLFILEKKRLSMEQELTEARKNAWSKKVPFSMPEEHQMLYDGIKKVAERLNEQRRTAAEVAKVLLNDRVPDGFVDSFSRWNTFGTYDELSPIEWMPAPKQVTPVAGEGAWYDMFGEEKRLPIPAPASS